MKALIIGGSKGIGKSIIEKLKELNYQIVSPSRKELDTSKIISVKKFLRTNKNFDVVILNTGGPPPMNFFDISEKLWDKYYAQLFLSFTLILQKLIINKNGYIFLISSHTIKNPEDKLILSNSFRVAFASVLKTYSKIQSKKKISCINIAPGPIKTQRLKSLVKNMKQFEKNLPQRYAAHPDEIGLFIKSIIQNKLKYLNGTTINFDGGLSPSLF